MGWNDRYPEEFSEHIADCKICGKRFRFITEEQIPGFRMPDSLYCPHCGQKLATSMEVEFSHVEKLEEEEVDGR